uniref:Arginine decarboxylase n=1 Tax=Solanum tuberosum TaxID=4113 RepID=M1BVY1_SOLTU
MATCSPGDTLILPRNCHISAISAMVLSGALPKYIVPEYDFKWDVAGGITPSQATLIPGEIITAEALNYLLEIRSKGAAITGAADFSLSSFVVCVT